MRINHNIAAMNTHRQLSSNQTKSSKSIEKLSSGLRINRAGDDAAGLAISEKMRGQIRGLDQATRNAQDGISLIQTAEGALNEVHDLLQRMRELAVQASNSTNVAQDREAISEEMVALRDQIATIRTNTEFNTQPLLMGGVAMSAIQIQVGANQGQAITMDFDTIKGINLSAIATDALTGDLRDANIQVDTFANAQATITTISTAINDVSVGRTKLGSLQNRLEFSMNNLTLSSENLQASESRIRDVDMAKELMESTKQNILSQAAQAMLAQANQVPQGVVQLLRG